MTYVYTSEASMIVVTLCKEYIQKGFVMQIQEIVVLSQNISIPVRNLIHLILCEDKLLAGNPRWLWWCHHYLVTNPVQFVSPSSLFIGPLSLLLIHMAYWVDAVITVIKGCQPVTHLHRESSKQGSWQELKYFEWVQLFLGFVEQNPFGYIDFWITLMNLIQIVQRSFKSNALSCL